MHNNRGLVKEFHHHVSGATKMAASFLNKIAALGLGAAVVGGVVNTALYNGKKKQFSKFFPG